MGLADDSTSKAPVLKALGSSLDLQNLYKIPAV